MQLPVMQRCSRTDTRFVKGGLSLEWGWRLKGRNVNEVASPDRTQNLPNTTSTNDGIQRITKEGSGESCQRCVVRVWPKRKTAAI
ncbi:hypothetical protein NPIL_382571 [Nephila pilipes]|uniref:Uncharacterized protein n=1 Tax=Nephila pilipes TaxID=299642 RepID=A0A8X6P376_NEPPI|nr:hypothetical protein NPIL_382571 [Nephila pilipes]